MEDVIEGVRGDIRIEAARDGPGLVRISFRYENATMAQRTAQDLMAGLIDTGARLGRANTAEPEFEILEPASLPAKPATWFALRRRYVSSGLLRMRAPDLPLPAKTVYGEAIRSVMTKALS